MIWKTRIVVSHSIRIAKRKENKTKEIRGLMRGPSSSSSRRSSSGQAVQLLDFSQHPQHAPTPPPACLRRSAPHRGQQRRTPRGDPGRCHLNLLLQMWKQSQKRQQERINLQTEKCKQNGNGEQRENRQKWLNLWLEVYLHKMEKLNTRRAQTLRKQERQKLCVVNITHRVLSVVPAYLLIQSRWRFLLISL